MKRLLKDREWLKAFADAARLQDCKLDPQTAFTAIQSADQAFNVDKLVKDSGAGVNAYWGAISDDAKFACEAYIYDGARNERKAAFVAAPVDNLNQMNVSIRSVERASEIKSMVRSGITFPDGNKLVFSNEYTNLEAAQAANQTEEQPADGEQQVPAAAVAKMMGKRLKR